MTKDDRRFILEWGMVIVVGVLVLRFLYSLDAKVEPDPSLVTNYEVYYNAVEIVKTQLKSPSTSDFPSFYNASVTNLGNDKYRVKSYVDAQNSFGAKLRQNWTVELYDTKDKVMVIAVSIE
jgi:hypothetical protein